MEGRVLLIEDNDDTRMILRERFESHGIQVDEAETGEAGVKFAARYLPQAIVVSTSLPDMRGVEVARQLRERTRTHHIFLLLLADDDAHQQRLSSLELGVDDFVASPFDPDELMLRVRNALRRANSSNLMDPATGLPAMRLVQEQLRRLVKDPERSWALMQVQISGLEAFREAYGFQAATDLLRDVARLLSVALSNDDVVDDFLGYTGSDDFIVITSQSRAPSLEDEIRSGFDKIISRHYGFKERLQGFVMVDNERTPLASLKIRHITPEDGPFYDIRSLSEALVG
jgi:DNA-binding response OmpR family regulator